MKKRYDPHSKVPEANDEEQISKVTLESCVETYNKITNNEQKYTLDKKKLGYSESFKTFKIQGMRDQLQRLSIDACWRTFHEQQDMKILLKQRYYLKSNELFKAYENKAPGTIRIDYSSVLLHTYERFATDDQNKIFIRLPDKKEFLIRATYLSGNNPKTEWEIRSFSNISQAKYVLKASKSNGADENSNDGNQEDLDGFKNCEACMRESDGFLQVCFLKDLHHTTQEMYLHYIIIYRCNGALIFTYTQESDEDDKEVFDDDGENAEDENPNEAKPGSNGQENSNPPILLKGYFAQYPENIHLEYRNSIIFSPHSIFILGNLKKHNEEHRTNNHESKPVENHHPDHGVNQHKLHGYISSFKLESSENADQKGRVIGTINLQQMEVEFEVWEKDFTFKKKHGEDEEEESKEETEGDQKKEIEFGKQKNHFVPLNGREEVIDPKYDDQAYIYRRIMPAIDDKPSYIQQISFDFKENNHDLSSAGHAGHPKLIQRVSNFHNTEGVTFFKSYHRGDILVAYTEFEKNSVKKAIRVYRVDEEGCHQMFLIKADFYDQKWSQIGYDEINGRLVIYEGFGKQMDPFVKMYETRLHFVDFSYYLSESNKKGRASVVNLNKHAKIELSEFQKEPEVVYNIDPNLDFGENVRVICTSKAIYYSKDYDEEGHLELLPINFKPEPYFSPIFIKEQITEKGIPVGFKVNGILYFDKIKVQNGDNHQRLLQYKYLNLTVDDWEYVEEDDIPSKYKFKKDKHELIYQINEYVFFRNSDKNKIYMCDTTDNNFSSFVEFTLKQSTDAKNDNDGLVDQYKLYSCPQKIVDFDLECVEKTAGFLKIAFLYKNYKNRITSLSHRIELTLNKDMTMTLINKVNQNELTYNCKLSTDVFDIHGNCFAIFNKDESRLFILDGEKEQRIEFENEEKDQHKHISMQKSINNCFSRLHNNQPPKKCGYFLVSKTRNRKKQGDPNKEPVDKKKAHLFRHYLKVTRLITIFTETGDMFISDPPNTTKDKKQLSLRLHQILSSEDKNKIYYHTTLALSESGNSLYIFNGRKFMVYSTHDFQEIVSQKFTKKTAPTSVMGVICRHYIRIYFIEDHDQHLDKNQPQIQNQDKKQEDKQGLQQDRNQDQQVDLKQRQQQDQATIYRMYRYKRIISIPASKMGILSYMLDECCKESEKEMRQEIIHNIVGLSLNITELDETYYTLMLIIFLVLNDTEDFADFVHKKIRSLIIYHRLLDVFVFFNEERDAWERIERYLDSHNDTLRFDFAYLDTVSTFMRRFLIRLSKEEGYGISFWKMLAMRWRDFGVLRKMFWRWIRFKKHKREIQDKDLRSSLSSELVRKMMRKIFMVDTGRTYVTEMKNKVYPIHGFRSLPHTDAEEADQVSESLRYCSETYPSEATDYKAYRTLFDVDYIYGTKESRSFFYMISKLPEDDLVKWYKPFFYMRFYSLWWLLLFWALVDWANSIICYIVFGRGVSHNDTLTKNLSIAIMVLVGLKFVYELICITTNWWNLKYWKEGTNYIDLSSQAAAMYLAIDTYIHPKEDYQTKDGIKIHVLKLITMFWLLARSVTWFRIFKPTRYLVTMIIVVFKEIFFFLIFMAIFILTFAFCWRSASLIAYLQELETGDNRMNFYASLLVSINIVFGNTVDLYDSEVKTSIVQTVIHVIGNIAIGLAYLNFLIAIISGVHEKVESNHHLYDVREIINLVEDFDMYYYGRKSIFNVILCGLCFKKKRKFSKRYILFLPNEETPEIENLTHKIDKMHIQMNKHNTQVLSELDKLKDRVESIQGEWQDSKGTLTQVPKEYLDKYENIKQEHIEATKRTRELLDEIKNGAGEKVKLLERKMDRITEKLDKLVK